MDAKRTNNAEAESRANKFFPAAVKKSRRDRDCKERSTP